MVDETVHRGIISGKMPGKKDHLRSMEIQTSDEISEKKGAKNIFRFVLEKSDGKYHFQCGTEEDRNRWIRDISKVKNLKKSNSLAASVSSSSKQYGKALRPPDITLPMQSPVSHAHSPRSSVSSTDSGLGPSTEGEVTRPRYRGAAEPCASTPSSADGKVKRSNQPVHPQSHSDDGVFNRSAVSELDSYSWFWGTLNRSETEARLQEEGKVGNFVIRINADGDYVMSIWKSDAIHHYKIVNKNDVWTFSKTAIEAQGSSLVDLLDMYMKICEDKSIAPFGDGLHLVYDEPWNPPDIDMEQLSERLRGESKRSSNDTKQHSSKSYISSATSTPVKRAPLTLPKRQPSDLSAPLHVNEIPINSLSLRKNANSPPEQTQQFSMTQNFDVKPTVPIPVEDNKPSEPDNEVYQNWTSSEQDQPYANWSAHSDTPSSNDEQIYQNVNAPLPQHPPPKPAPRKRT